MTEFNLNESIKVIGTVQTDLNTEEWYKTESLKFDDLDSSTYELGSPEGIFKSNGLKDPNLSSKNEQKDILESIFQAIEGDTFKTINELTGKFLHLHGQGLLGTLGGVLELVIGVLDALGITDDIISGIMGFAEDGGGALEAGVGAVIGQVFGNAKVNDAIKKGAERSNKFAEYTTKRVAQITEAGVEVDAQGDGHVKQLVTGNYSHASAKSVHKSFYSTTVEAPLMTFNADTAYFTNKTTKHITDLFSTQAQHVDYTIDDSFTLNANVTAITANNKRESTRRNVHNTEVGEYIASNELHFQAGTYAGNPFSVGDSLEGDTPKKLSMSSTEDIFTYAGRNYYLHSKKMFAVDSGLFLINCGSGEIARAIARPRPMVKVTPLPNPEQVLLEDPSIAEKVVINNGTPTPISRLSMNYSTQSTTDKFLS